MYARQTPAQLADALYKHRITKRERGLCGWAGCHEVSGPYYCPTHAASTVAKRKARRALGAA